MAAFRPPALESSPFLGQLAGQFETLARTYPVSSIDAFGTGTMAGFHTSLVNGYKLVGDDFFPLMYERPELVHDFLSRLNDLNRQLIDFWARLRGVTITDLNFGDCVASLLSPHLYAQFGTRHNAELIADYQTTYGIHSCGPSTHILTGLVRTPGAWWCEVGWSAISGQTDLAQARRVLNQAGCRELKALLTPGEVLQWSTADIHTNIARLIAEAGPGDLTVRVILESGITLDKVRALYQAVEG